MRRLTAHLFPPDHWTACLKVKNVAPGWRDVLDAYRVEVVLVDAADHPALIGRYDLDDTRWLIALGVDPRTADPHALIAGAVGEGVDAEILSTDPWTSKMLISN